MHDPSHAAWDAVIDTIAYLYYTRDMGITYYSKFKDFKLPSVQMVPDLHKSLEQIKLNHGAYAFCDGAWCEPSIVGFLVLLAGGIIDWATSIVKVTCLSSQHAEIAAAYRACKSIKYIRQLATDMGMDALALYRLYPDHTR